MAVNDAGHDELPRGVNHLSVFRRLDGLADFRDLGCVSHRPPPRTVEPGLTPVKSKERPVTLMEPFNVVPSKVPEKITSVGPWSREMLMVKLNLSALR